MNLIKERANLPSDPEALVMHLLEEFRNANESDESGSRKK